MMRRSNKTLLRANVYDVAKKTATPERNIRDVRVIYVGDILENKDFKIVVLQAEMWDYPTYTWQDVYGELAMKLEPDQTFDKPIFIPFDSLANVEWTTNRYEPLFVVGHRNL